MQKLVKQLKTLSEANAGKPVSTKQIILCQRSLNDNGIAQIPAEYVEILHHFNAFAYDGGFLYGIAPLKGFFMDIIGENLLADLPFPETTIVLGSDECCYLVWNTEQNRYQLIDKTDQMVLNTYTDCADAIRDILKIEDDD